MNSRMAGEQWNGSEGSGQLSYSSVSDWSQYCQTFFVIENEGIKAVYLYF